MAKEDIKALLKFLKPFPENVRERALWLREFAWDLYPKSNEIIYDNYNAVAFGWTPTEKTGHVFCSVAVGRSSYNVHFGFYHGSLLSDPKKMLLGNGNQYRYILVEDVSKFPKAYVKKLMKEAFENSLNKIKSDPRKLKKKPVEGATIVKSISPVKRLPAKRHLKKKD